MIFLFKLSPVTLFWVITATIFFSSVKFRYSDTAKVVFAEEQPYINSLHQASSIKNINIIIIKLRCISALRSWSHIKNTVVLTILTFQHAQYFHLMYVDVAWVLVSLGTQVQLQIILNPNYLPGCYFVSYDYGKT